MSVGTVTFGTVNGPFLTLIPGLTSPPTGCSRRSTSAAPPPSATWPTTTPSTASPWTATAAPSPSGSGSAGQRGGSSVRRRRRFKRRKKGKCDQSFFCHRTVEIKSFSLLMLTSEKGRDFVAENLTMEQSLIHFIKIKDKLQITQYFAIFF